jgi:ADP-ribose pyrophosphatase YjhB (NUDIX family)
MQVATSFIRYAGDYYFQLRDFEPGKGATGLVGCFGGSVRHGEAPLAAVLRELDEEISLRLQPQDLVCLGQVQVVSDRDLRPVLVDIWVYLTQLSPGQRPQIGVRDGQLVVWPAADLDRHLDEMTPGTRAACRLLCV